MTSSSSVDGTLENLSLSLGFTSGGSMTSPQQVESTAIRCYHCGDECHGAQLTKEEKTFCCQGCLAVHEILSVNGLERFYQLADRPGVRARGGSRREQWAFLDEPKVREQLLDFTDGKLTCVTFEVPAIHCVACIWLLENLFRLHPAIGKSQVNFPRREVTVSFATDQLALSDLAALLASIGYEPRLTLAELQKPSRDGRIQRQWLQIGIAGFAFGNIMLLSIPLYLGLDSASQPTFALLFGYLSLALALPVLLYSASDYWRAALLAFRQRVLTLDVPIALGLAALYLQSAAEIISGRGEGYLDSLAGLVLFLLCGRAFQQKSFERISFDRDYRCFFPLSALRKTATGEHPTALSELRLGDRLLIRNGELVPADSALIEGPALIDYSFVTGESEPVARAAGDRLYAGGRQMGSAIVVEIVKTVSQGYLASLWDHEVFRKESRDSLHTLTNRYSRRFTRAVIAIALGAGLFWCTYGQAGRGLKAFTSVLIVACPCALALAAPFALGTAQRRLARLNIFLKNTVVLEQLARVNTIVLDKTGTLTAARPAEVNFLAINRELTVSERSCLSALTRHSTHPHSIGIRQTLAAEADYAVSGFREVAGCGIEGTVDGRKLRVGSAEWLQQDGLTLPSSIARDLNGSASYVAIDGELRGAFVLKNSFLPEARDLLHAFGQRYELALLSGDSEKQRAFWERLFGSEAQVLFNQSPHQKLEFIHQLQAAGRRVMMVGDGLNDAGALKQSNVGVAVLQRSGAFSPASDIIMRTDDLRRLPGLLELGRRCVRIVHWSFGISAVYNLAGISIAACGFLSPLICAVLMPLSSVSVVVFACAASRRAAKRAFNR